MPATVIPARLQAARIGEALGRIGTVIATHILPEPICVTTQVRFGAPTTVQVRPVDFASWLVAMDVTDRPKPLHRGAMEHHTATGVLPGGLEIELVWVAKADPT